MGATALDKLKDLSTEETFKVKSKAMALNLLDTCYDVVTSHDVPAPFSQKIEMLKTVAKFADLEPKQNALPIGVGFSIKVIYSGTGPARGGVTIDHETSLLNDPPTFLTRSFSTDMLATLSPPET